MIRSPLTPQGALLLLPFKKVKFFIYCAIFMKFETHCHMFTNNSYNRNLWSGVPLPLEGSSPPLLIKVQFFIYGVILLKFETTYLHMFAKNNWDYNFWMGFRKFHTCFHRTLRSWKNKMFVVIFFFTFIAQNLFPPNPWDSLAESLGLIEPRSRTTVLAEIRSLGTHQFRRSILKLHASHVDVPLGVFIWHLFLVCLSYEILCILLSLLYYYHIALEAEINYLFVCLETVSCRIERRLA